MYKSSILLGEQLPPGKWRDPKDGIVKNRSGRMKSKYTELRGVNRIYDLAFRPNRRYLVTFTSMSMPDVYFQADYRQTSLRRLLSELSYHIGKMRKPDCAKHFTVTFECLSEKAGMMDIAVPVSEAQEYTETHVKKLTPKNIAGSIDEGMETI